MHSLGFLLLGTLLKLAFRTCRSIKQVIVAPKPADYYFFCKIHHRWDQWLQSDFKRGFSRWSVHAPKKSHSVLFLRGKGFQCKQTHLAPFLSLNAFWLRSWHFHKAMRPISLEWILLYSSLQLQITSCSTSSLLHKGPLCGPHLHPPTLYCFLSSIASPIL